MQQGYKIVTPLFPAPPQLFKMLATAPERRSKIQRSCNLQLPGSVKQLCSQLHSRWQSFHFGDLARPSTAKTVWFRRPKPTSVRASLAVILFAQNKKLPPHYEVNRKPVSSAVARTLETTGLLLYFWGQKKFLAGFQRGQVGLGFRCYSKVSLGGKVFAREEFKFFFLLLKLNHIGRLMTRPSRRKIYWRQISRLGGRHTKCE